MENAGSVQFRAKSEFLGRTGAALDWLRRSMDVHDGKGSAAFLALGKWAPPYPETTGYLIETLLNYADYLKEPEWSDRALSCGRWLLEVQHANGSFPALYAHSGQPSIFNTGMILFGLARLYKEPGGADYQPALERAMEWMLGELAPDGSWPQHAYHPGFIPSYYTRAVWAVLEAGKVLGQPDAESSMRKALSFYANRFSNNGYVKDWGFHPEKPAFTHTIAYTWRGFWEAAWMLKEEKILEQVIRGLDEFAALREDKGQTPGSLDEKGHPDFSFLCLTGNFQLSALAARIYQHSGGIRFRRLARTFFEEAAVRQVLKPKSKYHGGFAGSHPFWGPYQRFRYPNWAVKFFLDAYLALR
jgi:hypothetical protein